MGTVPLRRVGLVAFVSALAATLGGEDNAFTAITFKPALKCGQSSKSTKTFPKGQTTVLRVMNTGDCPISVGVAGGSFPVEPGKRLSMTFSLDKATQVDFACSSSEKPNCAATADWATGGAELDLADPTAKSYKTNCGNEVPLLLHHNLLKEGQKIKVEIKNTGECAIQLREGTNVLEEKKLEKNGGTATVDVSIDKGGGKKDFRVKCKGEKNKTCEFESTLKLQP